MKNRTTTIFIGAGFSIVLLLLFGILQDREAKFLSLSSQWIVISILPILVALFVGGYITKFKGFGIELEAALKETVSTSIDLKATDVLSDIPGDEKQSIGYLSRMPQSKALSIRWLVFTSGRRNYYTPQGIREYLMKLPNIEFVEVQTKEGQFVCYLPINYFKRDGVNDEYDLFNMDKINRFIVALEEENVKESFPAVSISISVKNSDNLLQVLKTLRDEQVDMAAVLSDQGRYIGVLFSRDVERKIADAVLKSKSA
jgi:hypothetical protein